MRAGVLTRCQTALLVVLTIGAATTEALATCGTRGGPGYRSPLGKCVGWAELGHVCGSPPTTRRTSEFSNPAADDAAKHGKAIDELKPPILGNRGSRVAE
jgi:hypothetical protein